MRKAGKMVQPKGILSTSIDDEGTLISDGLDIAEKLASLEELIGLEDDEDIKDQLRQLIQDMRDFANIIEQRIGGTH